MKYIFIDSNQYRHFFSLTEGFSNEIYNLLSLLIEKNLIQLLLPQQAKDEVERNRLRKWPEEEIKIIENKIIRKKELIKKAKDLYSDYSTHKNLVDEIQKEISQLEKEKDKIFQNFKNPDSDANKKLRQLFKQAHIIEEDKEILEKARYRYEKGNPPYGSNLGDSLIWESLLKFLVEKSGNDLVLISNDQRAWGEKELDKWLEEEYKKKVGGKIFYSSKLSDIPIFLVEEIEKVTEELQKEIEAIEIELKKREKEAEKRNAIIDFIASGSYLEAGENAKRLLQYKSTLTSTDYSDIIRGSLSNPQIYQSFFTQPYLLELVKGEEGYVTKEVESIDSELWRQFTERYGISLKRQSDQR